jgi:hypothetical protein
VVIVVLVLSLLEASAWWAMDAAAAAVMIVVLVLSLLEASAWWAIHGCCCCGSDDRRAGALLGGGIGLVVDGHCCRMQW